MAIKTPSKSKQETLDNIQMIVGKISESEELTQESIEDIDEKLGKKGLEDLVIGIDILIDKMTLASNMLVAIAGYLFGDKGINTSSNYASLTSKIKNTAPIFGDTPIEIPPLDTLSKPADEAFIYFDVTGIDEVETPTQSNAKTGIYNMNGQRLNSPQEGINIINGKKYIVK